VSGSRSENGVIGNCSIRLRSDLHSILKELSVWVQLLSSIWIEVLHCCVMSRDRSGNLFGHDLRRMGNLYGFILLSLVVVLLDENTLISDYKFLTTFFINKSLLGSSASTLRSLLRVDVGQLPSYDLGVRDHRITSVDLGLWLDDSTLPDLWRHALSA
jgi:hypothetical protein